MKDLVNSSINGIGSIGVSIGIGIGMGVGVGVGVVGIHCDGII